MRRRKTDQANGAQAAVAIPPGGVMEVKLSGSPESVRKHMGVESAAVAGGDPAADGNDGFIQALALPQNVVAVRRTAPRNWGEVKTNIEVWRELCPLTWQRIEDEIRTNHGGRNYRVAVLDGTTGETVAARTIEIDSDPIIPQPTAEESGDFLRVNEEEPSAAQQTEEMLDRQAKIAAKQFEVENITQQLESLRSRKNGKGADGVIEQKIADLERRQIKAEYEAKIDAMALQLAALKQPQVQPQKPEQSDAMTQLLAMMRDERKAADAKFDRLMDQMRDDKLTAITAKLDQIQRTPKGEGASLTETIANLVQVGKALGWNVREEEDDDDGEEKPWYETLAEKYLPKVFDLVEERQKDGKPMTKEEIVAQMNAAAEKAAKEEVDRHKARILQQQQAGLPAPNPSAPATPTAQVQAPAPTLPVQAPTPGPAMSVEDETKVRVAGVMGVLEREMELRVRDWQWSYAAWNTFPEAVLEKFATAADPCAALDTLRLLVNPEGVTMLTGKIQADAKVSAWIKRGHDELKGWWAKSQVDPSFDPNADEEEDGNE